MESCHVGSKAVCVILVGISSTLFKPQQPQPTALPRAKPHTVLISWSKLTRQLPEWPAEASKQAYDF